MGLIRERRLLWGYRKASEVARSRADGPIEIWARQSQGPLGELPKVLEDSSVHRIITQQNAV